MNSFLCIALPYAGCVEGVMSRDPLLHPPDARPRTPTEGCGPLHSQYEGGKVSETRSCILHYLPILLTNPATNATRIGK